MLFVVLLLSVLKFAVFYPLRYSQCLKKYHFHRFIVVDVVENLFFSRKIQASKHDKPRRGPDESELNDLATNLLEASQVSPTFLMIINSDL